MVGLLRIFVLSGHKRRQWRPPEWRFGCRKGGQRNVLHAQRHRVRKNVHGGGEFPLPGVRRSRGGGLSSQSSRETIELLRDSGTDAGEIFHARVQVGAEETEWRAAGGGEFCAHG